MNEIIDDNKVEPLPSSSNVVEDSIASRTKESTKRPKRERSPTLQIPTPLPKVKKIKEVAPKLPDKTKWTLEEQKQFFSALRIYGKNFEALGQCFNTRRRLINPEAQKRTFGQIRCFYYRSFRTVSKLCTFTEEEKSNVDSLELRSVLAYLCLKPKLKCFDKKPAITVLHQLIRNGNAFLRIKGQREHVSIIGKALKPPKTTNTLGSTKQTDRLLSKHIKIVLSPASANAYMRVALSCRYPHVEVLLTRTATIFELIDKLTHYWQLTNHAQTLFKDDMSQEQMILYPHLSYLSSSSSTTTITTNTVDSSLVSTDIIDSSLKKQMTMSTEKQFRSRSDSEHSTEPMIEPSSLIRKRSNPSESETSNEVPSTTTTTSTMTNNKSNLARTAILLAAKRAASTNTNTNNYDTSTFALMENVEDESDSNGGLLKQRFDILDLIDDFPSEDEIEPDTNVPTTISMTNNMSTLALSDLSQGISKSNCLFSTMTIGELQKILQRPKEIRLTYDFNNLSRTTNSNESSSTAFLHYVIQIANQCLTSIADRQSSIETKVTKKPNTKKHQTSRTRCYCSCCSHSHSINSRDQRRPGIKTTNSPNTELCVPIQMPIVSETISNNNNEEISAVPLDCDLHDKSRVPLSSQMDEQVGIFDNMTRSFETNQLSTVELPSVSTLLLPMTNTNESTSIPSQPVKQAAVMFSSNNGVIDDPLIQSLAAEQAASAHNYDLLSHRHKRVRRPLRYGDQSTRSTNIQLLLDANFNAHQTTTTTTTTTVVNKHFALSTNNTPDISSSSDNPFSGDCENPNDLLNDNTNMSTISLSTTIVNAALQSNTSRLRLDWLDNMSDLSFGSFPDLLESNTLSSIPDEVNNFEQSTVNQTNEPNKCVSDKSFSDAIISMNKTTNLLLQNKLEID